MLLKTKKIILMYYLKGGVITCSNLFHPTLFLGSIGQKYGQNISLSRAGIAILSTLTWSFWYQAEVEIRSFTSPYSTLLNFREEEFFCDRPCDNPSILMLPGLNNKNESGYIVDIISAESRTKIVLLNINSLFLYYKTKEEIMDSLVYPVLLEINNKL